MPFPTRMRSLMLWGRGRPVDLFADAAGNKSAMTGILKRTVSFDGAIRPPQAVVPLIRKDDFFIKPLRFAFGRSASKRITIPAPSLIMLATIAAPPIRVAAAFDRTYASHSSLHDHAVNITGTPFAKCDGKPAKHFLDESTQVVDLKAKRAWRNW